LQPILFSIAGFPILSFQFFIVLGVAAAYVAVNWAAGRRGVSEKTILLTALAAVLAGGIGTHLMTAFVYWVSLDHSAAALKRGFDAMSDTGVFVFAEIAIAGVAWRLKQNAWVVLDVWAVAAAIGSPIGRIGCLLAGCCYGQPTTMPWGLQYPSDHAGTIAAHGLALHPTPLYMSLGVFALWLGLVWLIRRQAKPGRVLLAAWGGYAAVRFTVEFFRADTARGAWFGGTLTTYQLIVASAFILHALLAWRTWPRQAPASQPTV
jgi:phosphatidylglycerol:prolipoprotein diacylglycerol transferase